MHSKRNEGVLLLIDDDRNYQRLAEHVCEQSGDYALVGLLDAKLTVPFLSKQGTYRDAPSPDLILLDLHLGDRNGLEILSDIRSNPDLWQIPVVMMSTNFRAPDLALAYQRGANTCIAKPHDADGFFAVFGGILKYWFGMAELANRA